MKSRLLPLTKMSKQEAVALCIRRARAGTTSATKKEILPRTLCLLSPLNAVTNPYFVDVFIYLGLYLTLITVQ